MNQLQDVMVPLNKAFHIYSKYHLKRRLINWIISIFGFSLLLTGIVLLNVMNTNIKGEMDSRNENNTMNGTMVEKPEEGTSGDQPYDITGIILIIIGIITVIVSNSYMEARGYYLKDPVHDVCEQIIKDFNEKSKISLKIPF